MIWRLASPVAIAAGEIMAKGTGNGAAFIVELAHDPGDTGGHGINIEGKIAVARFDPGGSQNCAGWVQDHIDVCEVCG